MRIGPIRDGQREHDFDNDSVMKKSFTKSSVQIKSDINFFSCVKCHLISATQCFICISPLSFFYVYNYVLIIAETMLSFSFPFQQKKCVKGTPLFRPSSLTFIFLASRYLLFLKPFTNSNFWKTFTHYYS